MLVDVLDGRSGVRAKSKCVEFILIYNSRADLGIAKKLLLWQLGGGDAWDFAPWWFSSSIRSRVGAENPRSNIHWLYMAMAWFTLLKALSRVCLDFLSLLKTYDLSFVVGSGDDCIRVCLVTVTGRNVMGPTYS